MLLNRRPRRPTRPRRPSRRGRFAFVVVAAALALASGPGAARAIAVQRAIDALLYRIFLRDGSTLVSYGDFARVADRVVFSIPLGAVEGPQPPLHLVSIAEAAVDWERTDRYAEAMRARRYAATRGEVDFEALSADVAKALNDIALIKQPAQRLTVATEARRRLADWPAKHYGYRASDVAQLATLLDDAIGEFRAAAGLSRVDLSLVATADGRVPDVPELPAPSERESIDQAFAAAAVVSDPTERVSLLEAIAYSLGPAPRPAPGAVTGTSGSSPWTEVMRAKAGTALAAEVKIDREYRTLVDRVIERADERTKRANVAGIEALLNEVLAADDKLGRKRPETTAALLATLDSRLDSARRLRLARDAWTTRRQGLLRYERSVRSSIEAFRRSSAGLQQIRQLSGPSPSALQPIAIRLSDALAELKRVSAPVEAEPVHSSIANAVQTAIRAASLRRVAVATGDMATAWEAASAAAGALLMFDRAQDELRKLSSPPEK
jgi:hypothetical protein